MYHRRSAAYPARRRSRLAAVIESAAPDKTDIRTEVPSPEPAPVISPAVSRLFHPKKGYVLSTLCPDRSGAEHPLWVYLPAGYTCAHPCRTLYIITDGRPGTDLIPVLDHLLKKDRVRRTLAVFLDAGSFSAAAEELTGAVRPFTEKLFAVSPDAAKTAVFDLTGDGRAAWHLREHDFYRFTSIGALDSELSQSPAEQLRDFVLSLGWQKPKKTGKTSEPQTPPAP